MRRTLAVTASTFLTFAAFAGAFGCSGGTASIDGPPGSSGSSGSSGPSGSSGSSSSSGGPLTAPEQPPSSSFSGAASGCGDVFAYRASEDGTQFVTVQVNREELGLLKGSSRTIDLATAPPSVKVQVDVFARRPTESKYCTDYATETIPSTTWTAEAGTLLLELGEPQGGQGSYTATIKLTGARLVGPERGTSVIVPSVEIQNVLVGWLPG